MELYLSSTLLILLFIALDCWINRQGGRRWRNRLRVLTGVVLVVNGCAFWYIHRPVPADAQQQLFQGITYNREVRRDPIPMIIHVITIDLTTPGLKFLVTPPDDRHDFDYSARTVSQFVEEFGVQLAINADGFDPWHDHGPWGFYPHKGEGTNARGLTVSQGTLVTEGYYPGEYTLYISSDNRVSFNEPIGEVYNAVSGLSMLFESGIVPELGRDAYLQQRHPRTAVALDLSGEKLFFILIDGRQPNYSEGATIPELIRIVLDYGGYTALNLDGGGSSALVIEGVDGLPQPLNSPIHTRIPGRERPIANHLGIYARPLSSG